MKKIHSLSGVLLTAAIIALSCSTARAQTNTNTSSSIIPTLPIPISLNFLTNVPLSTNFITASFGISVGAIVKSGGLENLIKADGYIRTNWMVSGEIQNAPVASVIDSFSLYGGYRGAWANAELYFEGGARRNFTTAANVQPSWQAVGLLGASWWPMDGGHFAMFGELGILSSSTGNFWRSTPQIEARAGTKMVIPGW